jgi:pimeloyl-ACP methyl ester carboxylesterase
LPNSSVTAPHRLFRKAQYGTDKFILVGKYKIHYVEAGEGEPVILIPGSYSTYRAWNRLMPLLGKEYRLLALDYLGVGDADKPRQGFDHTVREQTDLIAAMVRQLGLSKVNLIGGLYGGAIVFDFAARYPGLIDKIVSLEGSIVRPDKMKGDPLEYCLKFPLLGDLFVQVARSGVLNLQKISIASKTSASLEEEARDIKSPVLYLYGTQSDFKKIMLDKNLEYLKKYLPQAWIVALEGGIHDLALQKPAEVAGLILEFLHPRPAPRLVFPKSQK